MTAEEIRQAYQSLGKDHPAIKALLQTYEESINEIIYLLAGSQSLTEAQLRSLCGALQSDIEMRDAIKGAIGAD